MKTAHLLSTALLAGGTSCFLGAVAIASPEIASGDGLVNGDLQACLSRSDDFVRTLEVETERGQIDRTGYFGDGSFRILCYPNPYGEDTQSLVVVFAAHETDFTVADSFVQIAVSEIADQ